MLRFFNTAGPCDPSVNYMVPTEGRIPDVRLPVDRRQYFVLHAPRQSGKTTAMLELARVLRAEGTLALLGSVEAARGLDDIEAAEAVVIDAIAQAARSVDLEPPPRALVAGVAPGGRLGAWLAAWSAAVAPRPLVLFLDEVDGLRPAPLFSVLAQLRAGHPQRLGGRFPASVGLIGLRDLRDYVVTLKGGESPGPTSPFNVKVESFTLANFTEPEVSALLAQHTAESGQAFTEEATRRVLFWSRGQPYLVNALAGRCADRTVRDRSLAIDGPHIDEAAEHLVRARVTHLDNLAERLREPRIARLVQAVLLGDRPGDVDMRTDAFRYAVDLGLLTPGPDGAQAANPMYREVFARQLTMSIQDTLPPPSWPWRKEDGTLDFPCLMEAFRAWWRRHAETLGTAWSEGYPEAVPHLVFMAFLQRVVNGGGTVDREYAAGRGRIDLVVHYGGARHVVELKRVPPEKVALETIVEEGKAQLVGYLERLGEPEGWLVVFDQRPGRSWEERLWEGEVVVRGRTLHLVGG